MPLDRRIVCPADVLPDAPRPGHTRTSFARVTERSLTTTWSYTNEHESFYRRLAIPFETAAEQVKATCAEGVLEIRIP